MIKHWKDSKIVNIVLFKRPSGYCTGEGGGRREGDLNPQKPRPSIEVEKEIGRGNGGKEEVTTFNPLFKSTTTAHKIPGGGGPGRAGKGKNETQGRTGGPSEP